MGLTLKNCIINNKNTDLLIQGGKIAEIGEHKEEDIIDCKGLTLVPGLIDGHVHFREPGFEYKEDWRTGSRAAVKGGVTAVFDMPNTDPPTVDQNSLDHKRELAKRSIVNYGFYFGATSENIKLIRKIEGIVGIKVYFGSSTGSLLLDNPNDVKNLFKNSDRLFVVHAEDEQFIQEQTGKYKGESNSRIHTKIRPPEAAARAVETILGIVEKTKAKVHFCHISTEKELSLIAEAKQRNLNVTCEVTPHHLFLAEEEYDKQGNWVKINPPLRSKKDQQALWRGIKNGIIDTIGTDHAPHAKEEKKKSYWNAPAGVPGLETMLPLLLNEVNKGNLTLEELAKLTSENPARVFNLKNKGKIEKRYDADLVLIDQNLEKEIKNKELETKCGWSPFAGWKLKGWPVKTIIGGNIIYDFPDIKKNIKAKEVKIL